METKKVLGLDIGTNSIGAGLINLPKDFKDYGNYGSIEWSGSRIIPVAGDYLQKFEKGAQAETKAAFRRTKRGSRRLKHRYKLRRTRLVKIFKALGWMKEGFPLDDSRIFKKSINENGYSLKISDYLPFSDETIREFEIELGIDGNKSKKGKCIVPEDWIVYFARKKALEKKITIAELVRIIYMLNQRRGFKSSRKDLKDTNVLPYDEFINRQANTDIHENGIETQFVSITKIKTVTFKEEKKDKKGTSTNIYTIATEDPRMESWEENRKKEPDWVGKEFTFLVVQKIDKNGKFTQLKPSIPSENDWSLCTTALSEKIEEKDQHPGEYFYEQIKEAYKAERNFKARQYPVYRWRYQKELEAIWQKQCELNTELNSLNTDKEISVKLAEILYPTQAKNKMPKLAEFQNKDLLHIISEDIIYYQRELKSQKNSIGECRYEKRTGKEQKENEVWKETGSYGLKCIPRSSPLFQEFRIWQDIHNIRLLKKEEKIEGKTKIDVDVSAPYITEEVKEKLFDLFNSKLSVSEKEILELIKESHSQNDILIAKKGDEHSHRINLFAKRETLKGNETLARYRTIFKKVEFDGEKILENDEMLMKLWHIDYSITSSDEEKSKKGISTALKKILPNEPNLSLLIHAFCKLSELKREYGSYSAKAIRKLLPLMRSGKYWNEELLHSETKDRIDKLINGEFDENINDDTRKKIRKWEKENGELASLKDFAGLPTWLSGYIVYGIHSEKNKAEIKTVDEFTNYIQKEIPNNSIGNPLVEQVVRETMYVVRDIWNKYGAIDEIHIELGRDLKNNSAERERISKTQTDNFNEKQKIKKLLYELMNDGFEEYIDDDIKKFVKFEVNPNPESPVDIEKFRIWKSLSGKSELEWAKKIKDEKIPTDQEVKKYALWLSQNCRSPYTGKIIPLSKLFDKTEYEIEHIIPRKRMKNDSFSNLVIAEAAINPDPYKGNKLARNFISQFGGKNGKEYEINGKIYFILGEEEYESYCKETFKFQKSKLKNLLATEVPNDFVERQLNDTRHIGSKLAELLTPVARSENGILFTGGSITSELKKCWGLNSVWKEIILPRFERLEKITERKGQYLIKTKDDFGNEVIHFNVEENPALDTKRIDHRHHAMDALIIAATTREHIRYLNTLNAADSDEEIKNIKRSLVKGKIREFKQPWDDFTKNVKDSLESLVVTFKTNNKIISKPQNRTAYLKAVEGKKPVIDFKSQKANPRWMSVRKSMFKEPQGIIYLKEVYEEKSIVRAIEIQIDRMLVQNKPEMRIAPYVYDQEARKIIRELIDKIGVSIQNKDELLKSIKNHLKKNKLKDFFGNEYKFIKVAKFEEYAAKRVALDDSFDHKKIDKIPYAKTRKSFLGNLLHEHLDEYEQYIEKKEAEDNLESLKKTNGNLSENDILELLSIEDKSIVKNPLPEPFKGEGLERLSKKAGKPITKVTIYEKKDESSKFGKQYVEVDSGSNVYFVMYENQQTKERSDFSSISTHKAIEKIVKKESIAEDKEGYDKIMLSPGDLVYIPTKAELDEISNGVKIDNAIQWGNKKLINNRTYKVGRFSKKQCYFLKSTVSDLLISYDAKLGIGEFGSTNYQEFDDEKNKIADVCVKLKVDRLGNISRS